jgi:hypothetical protein
MSNKTEFDEIEFEDAPPVPKVSMPVTAERSFFAALRALRHLYFKLETDRLELHSACEVCDEIRNFLDVPNYRADDFDAAFSTARSALKHLSSKLSGEGMEFHSESCLGCNEIKAFVTDPEYRGNLNEPLEVDMHRPLNYAPLGWIDERYEQSLKGRGGAT